MQEVVDKSLWWSKDFPQKIKRNVTERIDWTRLLDALNIRQSNSKLALQEQDSHCQDPKLGDSMKNKDKKPVVITS